MKINRLVLALALSGLGVGMAAGATAAEAEPNSMGCEMTYTLSGWSVIYKTASGSGTITCDNGKTMAVKLSATGGGLTVGKYDVHDGHGEFAGVKDISDVLGSYAMATAHAGVVQSTRAMALTKGDVSLALTGQGSGWNVGAGFASFTIKKVD